MHKKVKNYIAAVVVTVIFGAAAVANMDISYGSMESEKERVTEYSCVTSIRFNR